VKDTFVGFLFALAVFGAGYVTRYATEGEPEPSTPGRIDTVYADKPYTLPKDTAKTVPGKPRIVYDSSAVKALIATAWELENEKARADSLEQILYWTSSPFDFEADLPNYIVTGTVDRLSATIESLAVQAKPFTVDSMMQIKEYVPVPPTFWEKAEFALYGAAGLVVLEVIAILAL